MATISRVGVTGWRQESNAAVAARVGVVGWYQVKETAATTHTTSGTLTGPGASVAGTAAHLTLHATSGALTGQGSSVAGTAVHPHTTTGTLAGPGAIIVGSADHTAAAGTHDTSGTLTGPGAAVAGTAAHLVIHTTIGVLVGSGTIVEGVAAGPIVVPPLSSGGRGGGGVGWSKAEWKKRKQLDEAIEASLKEQLTSEDKVEIAQEIAGPRATKAQIAEIVKQLTPAPRPLMMPAPRQVVEDDDDEVAVRLLLEEDHADLHILLRKVRDTVRDL